jgi:hypothetical protein
MGDVIMRMRFATTMLAASVGFACSSGARQPTQPESITLPLVSEKGAGGSDQNHTTHLSGDQEVFAAAPGAPTPADSHAQGQAIFKIESDDSSFDYKLIASNIENITQAHIHCGVPGMNGPIVVWLYPSPLSTAALPGGAGRHDGVLAEGTVESSVAAHVRPAASSAACPGGIASFADVLAKMRAGNAYVNVHTNDGVAPTNTGPGDFPGGEIRGQFK